MSMSPGMMSASVIEAGFSGVLEILIVVVIIAILGFVGWTFYHRHHTKPVTSHTSSSSTTSVKQHSSTATTSTTPYAGWESYCSSTGGICLKYPSTWVETTQAGLVTFTSPTKAVTVQYNPSLTGVGGYCALTACTFNEESATPIKATNTLGLEVIKGIFTNISSGATIVPSYFLASPDRMASYHLELGQTVDVGYFGGFFTSPLDSSSIEQLQIVPVPNNGFSSDSAADAWLAQPEVTTAGQILGSVTLDTAGQ